MAKVNVDPFSDSHPIFGATLSLDQISEEKLPTQLDVLNLIRGLKRHYTKLDGTIDRKDQIKIYSEVATLLTDIWKSAHIPVVSFDWAKKILEKHFDKILREARQTRDRILKSDESKAAYLSKLKKVYNFAKCRCFISAGNVYRFDKIEDIKSSNCKCNPKDRIPQPCLTLFGDQMFERKLIIWFSEEDKQKLEQISVVQVTGNLIYFSARTYLHPPACKNNQSPENSTTTIKDRSS